MIIFPAIDIKDGQCVRLLKGDYDTAHKVSEDPIETACSFKTAGAKWVHMVDLDAAKSGRPENAAIFTEVAKKSGLLVELGGGIRNMQTAEVYFESGISRLVLGSAAVADPAFLAEALKTYGGRIAVGIDCKDGYVSTDGWTMTGNLHYIEFAKRVESMGAQVIIFTDIAKDGMLSGPNFSELENLKNAVSCHITASGGIRNIEDIRQLRDAGFYGAICGKSIYAGTLDLKEAIQICDQK